MERSGKCEKRAKRDGSDVLAVFPASRLWWPGCSADNFKARLAAPGGARRNAAESSFSSSAPWSVMRFPILQWAEHQQPQKTSVCLRGCIGVCGRNEAKLCAKLVRRFRRVSGHFSGFLQLLCHLWQGCNKVAWAAVGAAVVITLITITAVYVSSKWKLTGPCVCVCVCASGWRGVCKETQSD